MLFKRLAELFREHADMLRNSAESSAPYRARSYEAAAAVIEAKTKAEDHATKSAIDSLELTDYMKNTAKYVIANGHFKKSTETKEEKVDSKMLLRELTDNMGIGLAKAQELIDAGLKKSNQIHMKKFRDLLTDATKLFLDKKPNSKIPNSDIKKLEPYILIAPYKIKLVGSYRRNKEFSSDIDVMVVDENPDVLAEYKNKLAEKLEVYPYSVGQDKFSLIVDARKLLANSDSVYKIDVFRCSPANEIPMLLYSTGSKEFNIRMRSQAKKKGFLLNQLGLFRKKADGSTERVPDLNTEKDYFDILGMTYLEPHERV
jgi:DNA polymerase (family 10)